MSLSKPVFKEKGCVEIPEQFKDLFDGYFGEQDDGVFISFIKSKHPQNGNFSKLLNYLKENYRWIKVPTPSNTMRLICLKKGFVSKMEFFPEPFNEVGEIMFWEKPQSGGGK